MQLEKIEIEDYQPTEEELRLADLIAAKDGNISAVAIAFNRSRRTIYHRIEKSPYLKAAVSEAREALLDDAESILSQAVRRGEAWAVCFVLKTIGKRRGYTEKNTLDVNAKVMTVADFVRMSTENDKNK